MASVASIDNWSDSEIRTKLAELGTPVGPVTETTRKILIKKLKRLLQLQNNNAGSPSKRRSLVRYSSGEDSQGEEANMPPPTTKIKNLRRKTVGPAELLSTSENSMSVDVSRSIITDRTTRGSRKTMPAQKMDPLDTDSDSDISLTYLSSRLRKSRKSETVNVPTPSKSEDSHKNVRSDSPKLWNSVTRTSDFISSSSRVPELQKPLLEDDVDEEEELEDTEGEEDDAKAPVFQSAFLTRLSTAGQLPSSYRSSVSPKREWKSPTSSYSPSAVLQRGIRSVDDKIFSTRHEVRNSYTSKSVDVPGYSSFLNRPTTTYSSSSFASKSKMNALFTRYKKFLKLFIVGGVAIVLLIAMYFLFLPNFSTRIYLAALDSDENKYPICGQEGVDLQICVQENQLKSALDVSKVFIPRVLEVTTKAYCDSSSDADSIEVPIITEQGALKYLAKKLTSVSAPNLERDVRNFKILTMANPHWEIEIVGEGLKDVKAKLFNGDFAARQVDLPTACYLRLMGYKLMKTLFYIAILVGSGFGILFGVRLYKRSQERHKQEVYSMINQILNLLSAHHEQNVLPAYLAINNCRDELISPSERDRKKRVWDDAVEFLEKHESRVRTEVHSIRGENVKVWRWLPAGGPPVSPNTSFDTPGPVLGRLL